MALLPVEVKVEIEMEMPKRILHVNRQDASNEGIRTLARRVVDFVTFGRHQSLLGQFLCVNIVIMRAP